MSLTFGGIVAVSKNKLFIECFICPMPEPFIYNINLDINFYDILIHDIFTSPIAIDAVEPTGVFPLRTIELSFNTPVDIPATVYVKVFLLGAPVNVNTSLAGAPVKVAFAATVKEVLFATL
jgi:hypothetical protein